MQVTQCQPKTHCQLLLYQKKKKKISLFEMNKELQFTDFSIMTKHMQIPTQQKENSFKEKKNWE